MIKMSSGLYRDSWDVGDESLVRFFERDETSYFAHPGIWTGDGFDAADIWHRGFTDAQRLIAAGRDPLLWILTNGDAEAHPFTSSYEAAEWLKSLRPTNFIVRVAGREGYGVVRENDYATRIYLEIEQAACPPLHAWVVHRREPDGGQVVGRKAGMIDIQRQDGSRTNMRGTDAITVCDLRAVRRTLERRNG